MKQPKKIPFEAMPFYESLIKVQNNTNLDTKTLQMFQIGFKATPDTCGCGKHEWSVYDLMIESVERGAHEWSFYTDPKFAEEAKVFFSATEEISCPACGKQSKDVSVRYSYGGYVYDEDPASGPH